ncbi:MAG: acyl carrier protein [Oscillospiraceae bacterium]|nr:acyl carrier protein [Oscillospiraceae bacterium]MDD6527391.1 acyl carrier protein [Oscillospiraceae bacterium]
MYTFETVCDIVNEKFEINDVKLTEDTTWDEIGADSIDLVDLISEIESDLNISIPDEAIEDLKTIGDLVRYLEENA